MGRYYNSASGDVDGKFGFGVQASDAGEKFGMTEVQDQITLYTDDADEVLAKINEIFDAMGVPEKDRQTDFTKSESFQQAIYDWAEKINLWGYAVEEVPVDQAKNYKDIPYHSEKEGYVGVVKSQKNLENYYDLILGLEIYNDILKNGYCELYCEI